MKAIRLARTATVEHVATNNLDRIFPTPDLVLSWHSCTSRRTLRPGHSPILAVVRSAPWFSIDGISCPDRSTRSGTTTTTPHCAATKICWVFRVAMTAMGTWDSQRLQVYCLSEPTSSTDLMMTMMTNSDEVQFSAAAKLKNTSITLTGLRGD